MSTPNERNYSQSDRSKVPDEFKWKIEDLFASVEKWQEAKASLVADIPRLDKSKGKLSESPAMLFGALERYWRQRKDVAVLNMYANMLSDQDTRESPPLAMVQQIT